MSILYGNLTCQANNCCNPKQRPKSYSQKILAANRILGNRKKTMKNSVTVLGRSFACVPRRRDAFILVFQPHCLNTYFARSVAEPALSTLIPIQRSSCLLHGGDTLGNYNSYRFCSRLISALHAPWECSRIYTN